MNSARPIAADGPDSAAPLALPRALVRQLDDFRAAVRRVKGIEAAGAAVSGVVGAWLVIFVLDRCVDTPAAVRFVTFVAALFACGLVPRYVRGWIWGLRGTERVARLVARRFPSLGDQLLGAAELVGSRGEQHRSRVLCEAAIRQVAEAAGRQDLRAAVPRPRHRLWAATAVAAVTLALVTALAVPAAAGNAWARLLAPWRPIERYTFARIDALPDPLVVPHGEAVTLPVTLAEGARWKPSRAVARLGTAAPISAPRGPAGYALSLPALVGERTLRLAAGDARQRVAVVPTHRPEIVGLAARVRLPDYLGLPETATRNLRGGGLAVVKGSRVEVVATADRPLATARVDDMAVVPHDATIDVPERIVEEPVTLAIAWEDRLGLSGAKPLAVRLVGRDDEAPSIVVEGLSGRGVILDTETLRFTLRTRDDFGVRATGLEWIGDAVADEARGEEILATGAADAAALDAVGTFCPAALGIAPQTVTVRAWVEDRLPGRGRVRSAPVTFAVMNATDHVLWVNDQISRWRQQAAEVRDREMELFTRNEELLALDADDLDAPQQRKAIREQAAAERANARRLGKLVEGGAELVRQATRNPEFDADALDELAEHVATLEEMATRRMPGVGELLDAAAKAARGGDAPAGEPAREGEKGAAGESAAAGDATPGAPRVAAGTPDAGAPRSPSAPPAGPSAPQVSDSESSQAARGGADDRTGDDGGGPAAPGALGLPTTTVGQAPGGGGGGGGGAQRPLLAAAVDAQRRLIDEFAAIARELADVMSRLEGTTFVKRLKSASRSEAKVGTGLSTAAAGAFGRPRKADGDADVTRRLREAGKGNEEVGEKLSTLMDDLDAYAERRPRPEIRSVLEEMKELDVLGSLRQLGDEVATETGLSIARAEYWADTFDRWADELVPPPGQGGGPGSGRPPESLPPAVVLEAMRILEAEADLREETRVAEQRRAAIGDGAWSERAAALSGAQGTLAGRVRSLADRLADEGAPMARFTDEIERMRSEIVPRASTGTRFAREIGLFREVARVMDEARGILVSPDTGRRAVAAETEAIELLLQSQFGGGGGGGGGASPGGGAGGTTRDRALARLGQGFNLKARLEAPEEEQAVGRSGRTVPEEFRDGLDAYFNALERQAEPERGTP